MIRCKVWPQAEKEGQVAAGFVTRKAAAWLRRAGFIGIMDSSEDRPRCILRVGDGAKQSLNVSTLIASWQFCAYVVAVTLTCQHHWNKICPTLFVVSAIGFLKDCHRPMTVLFQ